ncbi:MAG TPA: biotin transporter BioY [Rubellimicrobium sp.]|nr:biotin transporter BioY [Rubellimicrobium sp.]
MTNLTTAAATLPGSLGGIGIALGGSWLLALSAHVSVPMVPVPMTLQTLALLVLAGALGLRRGTAAVLAYLGQGALGLPVFAGGGGVAYMAGPTGGFLLGFLLCAVLVGWAVDQGARRNWLSLLAALSLGHVVVFVPGVMWLATFMGLDDAWTAGAAPFLPGTVLKTALALMLLLAGGRTVRRLTKGEI